MKKICWTVLLLHLELMFVSADRSVHILAENLDQFVTSTTLEWVPNNGNTKGILKHAVVAAYQTTEDAKDNEAEVTENDTGNGMSNKPVYVCRAKFNSVWVSGQLRPQYDICVVSLYGKVSEYKQFDILTSIEGSARLSWVNKNKYILVPQGAVQTGENMLKTFVGRRVTNSHNKEGSLTHFVGRFNDADNLGVFYVVDQNNMELNFEDGQILVEAEPVRYELKSIRYDHSTPARYPKQERILGEATLKNEESGLQRVDSVISYRYIYSLFWGKGHGLLTGLPLQVFYPNNTQIEGVWAIPRREERVEIAPIERYLEEGTAVNVTLKGNYTESEVPYIATVVAIYKDGEKREIQIKDTKRENKMMNIIAVYDPVYFIHNNSHVPTTTTTTTTTTTSTTSTTSKTTSTTQEITPIPAPDLNGKGNKSGRQLPNEDEENILKDQGKASSDLTATPSPGTTGSGAAATGVISLAIMFAVSFAIRRVT